MVTKESPQELPSYSSKTLDPYAAYVDGKLIWKEFQTLNNKRNSFLSQDPNYQHIERIELRFIPHNKGDVCAGADERGIITITKEQVEAKQQICIGRGLDSDIRIQGDESVSRKHCFITRNENNEWVLNANQHEVYWSLRLESEWPEVRYDFDEVFGDKDYDEYKRSQRDTSTPIFLQNKMQMRVSDTLFEFEFN